MKCFAIMQFEGMADIEEIIRESAEQCGLEYERGDRQQMSGTILPQIRRAIVEAQVVVADISFQNPNVFYELGIAHEVKPHERVVIITQHAQKSPFDVQVFRQLAYSNSREGRSELRSRLPGYLRAALKSPVEREAWDVIRGHLPRTLHIIADLKQLLEDPDLVARTTIRMTAGLGSMAISDLEKDIQGRDVEYVDSLIEERDLLRKALSLGASLKAVLNPPRRFTITMQPDRLHLRYQRLIGLLEGRSDVGHDRQSADLDLEAMKRCEFALSPVPMPHLFIIGHRVAYEGMKRAGAGGYEMTHCETERSEIEDLIRQFDIHFDVSKTEMLRTHPPDGMLAEQLKGFYSEASKHERDASAEKL